MSKKCETNGERISLCEELEKLSQADNKISKITMVYNGNIQDEFIGQITYKYGRKKSEEFAFSFCPCCGGNIKGVRR